MRLKKLTDFTLKTLWSTLLFNVGRMGQTLSEPITNKDTQSFQNKRMRAAASSMQGWRINMEDAHTVMLDVPGQKETSFFAVYDGHGGYQVAQYSSKHLHDVIMKQTTYGEGKISEALKSAFLKVDDDMRKAEETQDELAGSTAICVLVKGRKIYCANVGDSRAVLSKKGQAVALSEDHKPNNIEEAKRIQAAGGWVEFNRVNGNLALSRALGDFIFKTNSSLKPEEQIVTAEPDIKEFDLSSDVEFLLLACDGIWDMMNNQEVVDFVRHRLAQGMEPQAICEDLMMNCLAPDCQLGGLGCDNMTVVLVCLLGEQGDDKGWDHLVSLCSTPASTGTAAQRKEETGDSNP